MQSKIDKMCFLLQVKAFEVIAGIYAYCVGNTWGVNVLTNSLKVSDMTKADFFELYLSRIHGKIEK